MSWRVFVGGKDSGIVESNYAYASHYWADRSLALDKKIELRREK